MSQGVMAEQIAQHVSGFSNWSITKHAQSYLEAFEGRHEDLVYLTAGADFDSAPHQLAKHDITCEMCGLSCVAKPTHAFPAREE